MSNTTEAQLRANRANAEKSTGPKTEEGKRIASHNALKTGLTGRTILLPTDDVAAYQDHLAQVESRYEPKTGEERLHTQTIANIEWRLERIPMLETGILALGRKQFADSHAEEPADTRAIFIEAEVHLAHQKTLANLALQETRLNRQHDRTLAKLESLQKTRKAQEQKLLEEAAHLYEFHEQQGNSFPLERLQEIGFEFSLTDIIKKVALKRGHIQRLWPTLNGYERFQEMLAA